MAVSPYQIADGEAFLDMDGYVPFGFKAFFNDERQELRLSHQSLHFRNAK